MPKGARGAKAGGGRAKATPNRDYIAEYQKRGTILVEADKLDTRAVNEVLGGMDRVLTDMGVSTSVVSVIAGRNSAKGSAAVNGFGQLTFNNAEFSSYDKAVAAAKGAPGHFTAPTLAGTGAHEAGHLLENAIIAKEMATATNLERSTARIKSVVPKSVMKEAIKIYGSNPKLSGYGSTNVSEKMAEAVADHYINGANAHPFSTVVVGVIKKRLQ